jgi:2-cysteine adaptor domain
MLPILLYKCGTFVSYHLQTRAMARGAPAAATRAPAERAAPAGQLAPGGPLCSAWLAGDKAVNPATGRRIRREARHGVYAAYERACAATEPPSVAEVQRRYCSCLMKARPGLLRRHASGTPSAPYAVCHAAVLARHPGVPRPRACAYDFPALGTEQLLAYARELAGRKRRPLARLPSYDPAAWRGAAARRKLVALLERHHAAGAAAAAAAGGRPGRAGER